MTESPQERSPIVVLHVTTVPMSLTFLRGQTTFMRARGFEVHAVSSPGPELRAFGEREGMTVHAVRMTRRITPLADLRAWWGIRGVIRRVDPDIVHAHTPKAGLLAMIAAARSSTAVRIYQLRGAPYQTARGWKGRLLRTSEWVSCRLADRVLCNSRSLCRAIVDEGVCEPDKIDVLGEGSGNGVDAEDRFNPARLPTPTRAKTRLRLGIPADALVLGFVGRLTSEKGVVELTEAWSRFRASHPEAHLILVGPFEDRDPIPEATRRQLEADPRVHLTGMDWDTPPLYAAMDVVVLPTYREGFPNVPLEAAAMGLPVVATRVEGCVDAVVDGVTGLLVAPRDSSELLDALEVYAARPDLRSGHGAAGRLRVLRDFRPETIRQLMHAEYTRLIAHGRSPVPAYKRTMDVLGAVLALILLAPLLALIAIAVRVVLGRPVLFVQRRPGWGGRPFSMVKFRTMREGSDPAGRPLPDEQRLTGFGRILRKTSLDELPELWNVLKGDMSLVGPRPLLMEYLPLYSPNQARRHRVRPGITGWAQVNGRNDTSWERRLELDAWYVDHQSLALDLRVLVMTLRKVLRMEGIQQQGRVTMEKFTGSGEIESCS